VQGPCSLSAFSVDAARGALTPLAGSPSPTGGNFSGALALDPTSTYLVATNFASGTVAAFERDPASGELDTVPGSPFTPAVGTVPLGVTFDPSGKFAYVPDQTSFSLSSYSIDSDSGVLTFVDSRGIGAQPVAFVRVVGLQ
jgi:6-phosphogluconolactonase (cycloisomerase 2 family)